MGDLEQLQTQVLGKLSLINNLYFKSSDKQNNFTNEGIFGGQTNSGLQISIDKTFKSVSTNGINLLFNLPKKNISSKNISSKAYTNSQFVNTIKTTDDSTHVYQFSDKNNRYESVKINIINNNIDITKVNEINCLSLLYYNNVDYYKTTFTKADKTTYTVYPIKPKISDKIDIYLFMQGLYTLYNLFEPNTWETYIKSVKNHTTPNLDFYIPTIRKFKTIYELTTNPRKGATKITNSNLETYISYVSSNKSFINDIIYKSSTFNPFVARRLILMWILLCNYYIAMSYYNTMSIKGNVGDKDLKNIKDLVTKTYEIIVQTNTNVMYNITQDKSNTVSSEDNTFKKLNNVLGNYVGKYNKKQKNINSISNLLTKGKTNLSTIQNLLNGRIDIQKTQKICEYVAMVIMILFSLFAISIVILDIDKKKKLYACIGLIVFSLINFLGIQILLNSSIFIVKATAVPVAETFENNTNPSTVSFTNQYNTSVMYQVSQFLDNTITLTTLLESYKAYGNMNTSMDKELSYYSKMVGELNNAQEKINNIYYASYINTIDVSALLQLFQILTIIIAATCTGYVMTQNIAGGSINSWILGIAAVLVVISLVIYMMEITQRVHTDPSKYYWSKPAETSFGS